MDLHICALYGYLIIRMYCAEVQDLFIKMYIKIKIQLLLERC